jgi:hypothetical protein
MLRAAGEADDDAAAGPVAVTGIIGAVGNISSNPGSKFTIAQWPSSAEPTSPTRVPTQCLLLLLGNPHGTATLNSYTEERKKERKKDRKKGSTATGAMHSLIRPNTHVALRLPSGLFKVLEITPNTYVAYIARVSPPRAHCATVT